MGSALLRSINALVNSVAMSGSGPVALAQALGLDKVLASRVLKAVRQQDAVASMFFMPGPEPLRALVKAADRRGSPRRTVEAATAAIAEFERLIDVQIGDRSLLDSILSAWIPDARAEFELRRKQAAFKALSQLRGVQADAVMATCVLAASDPRAGGAGLMDVTWVHGLTGLHRVRPGVVVKIASRRMSSEPSARKAQRLDGRVIDDDSPPLVDEFCSTPRPEMHVHRVKDSMFYLLGGDGFGAGSAVDVMFAEVNRAELKHPSTLAVSLPGGEKRGVYFFAETAVPAKSLQFDLMVEDSLFAPPHAQEPTLRLYDTAFEGVADVFDPRRDLDRLDMLESIVPLGRGLAGVRSGAAPRYQELMKRVMDEIGYEPSRFKTYRCVIDYPLYGSQVAMLFPTVA
ncbi:MAG: hypothetical protein IT438_07365 [Phycisphaerales bacterium]|nr:hypothetical protein [Phycisphaerales bacterium]